MWQPPFLEFNDMDVSDSIAKDAGFVEVVEKLL
jgi:hypothetical protein